MTYTITEQDNPDFDLEDITCEVAGGETPSSNWTPSGNTVSIDLAAEDLVCTFTNKPTDVDPSQITLRKKTTDDSEADFTFTSTIPEFDNKTLTTTGGLVSFGPVDVSGGEEFSITELDNPDYDLVDASCKVVNGVSESSGSNSVNTGGDLSGNTLTFTPTAGVDYVCTFKNEPAPEGTIIIKKIVDPSTSTRTFDFTTDFSGTFSLGHDETQTFSVPIDDTYTITEVFEDDFDLESINCTASSNEVKAVDAVRDGEVDITFTEKAPADASITCTYTNKLKTGSLKVVKETIGGNDDFDFVLTGPESDSFQLRGGEDKDFPSLPVGQYTIKEEELPEGWTLKTFSCDRGGVFNNPDRKVTVTLDKNEAITCTFVNFKEDDEEMEEEVEKFNETTLKLLLTHGPDRARLVRRLQEEQPLSLKDTSPLPPLKMTGEMGPEGMQGGFSMSLSGLRASMMAQDAQKIREAQEGDGMKSSFADDPYIAPYMMTRPGWDLWIEGQISRYSDDSAGRDRDGTFSILYVGADYAVAPGVIVGALVQVDHTDQDIDGDVWGEIEGTGWMVGPYFGAKIGDNLIFDARAAWGQSDNDIELESEDGGYRTGDFDMERWLVTGKLTGMYHYNGWRISPHVGVAWGTQDQDAFTNSLGQRVGSSDVTLGQLTFGPEFGYRYTGANGATIEPHLAIEGIWNFEGNEIDFASGTESTDDFRAKVEGGFIYATPDGYKVRAAGSYDGIGGDDFEAWSAKAWVNIPLDNGYAPID